MNTHASQNQSMNQVFSLNVAQAEDSCPDNEQNVPATQDDCTDGSTCECDLCITGKTDCTPTCPCCE